MRSSSTSSVSPPSGNVGKSFNPVLFGRSYLEIVFNLPNNVTPAIFGTHRAFCAGVKEINLLKPTGHVMHQQFNIQQLYVLPTLYLCVLLTFRNLASHI